MEKKSIFTTFNWLLFVVMGLLILYGTMMILSTIISKDVRPLENTLFVNQLLNITIGLIGFVILSQIDYRIYFHLHIIIFIFLIVLLALVPIIGFVSHGATRWYDLGVRSFQPSEFAKLLFIVSLGAFLLKYQKR